MGSTKRFDAILTGSLICLGVGVGSAVGSRLLAHPKPTALRLTPASVNFGQIGQGVVVTQTIWLHNDGDHPLPVANVGSTCGCTTTKFSGQIPAHSSAPLTIRYDSHGAAGQVRQAALLTLADAQKTLLEVPIVGTVTHEVEASQAEIDLGSKSDSVATLTLTRLDKKPLVVSPAQVSPALDVTITPLNVASVRLTAKRRHNAEGTSTPLGEAVSGTHHFPLVLRLKHPRMPEFVVPVSWVVPGRYPCLPETINLGAVAPGTAVSRSVIISPSLETVNRLKLEHVPAGFHAFLSPVRSHTGKPQVRLVVSGTLTKGGLINDTITLQTGDAREPRLVLPIVAAVGSYADTATGDACRAPSTP